MRVYKFGGASVNSAEAVRNMAAIVASNLDDSQLIVVVSAMGKTTNLLERLVPTDAPDGLYRELEEYHRNIAAELLPGNKYIQNAIGEYLSALSTLRAQIECTPQSYNYRYDQIVSIGELLSTTIVSEYLRFCGIEAVWMDARTILRTDDHFREGRINWESTLRSISSTLPSAPVVVTQGFIAGCDSSNATTTLGREGSDYSAAIIAYCTEAESVTIWKDVPGFLNADPKYFPHTIKISHIPYNEAIELAYYGASVIHPKTVKPLQNKGIPLYIRSFVEPQATGSAIGDYRSIDPETPLYIFRNEQLLLSVIPKDFSFIAEDNLQSIFGVLNDVGVRVNLMQNSALSFSICVDNNAQIVPSLMERLRSLSYIVRYNEGLQLITIRYYNQSVIDSIVAGRPILLEQRSRLTAQLVVPFIA